MQFRLSTLFLVFFTVAASLALCISFQVKYAPVGLWFAAVILTAALLLNRIKNYRLGIIFISVLIFFGIICMGLPLTQPGLNDYASYGSKCRNNLEIIGRALHDFQKANQFFPLAYKCDQNGKPLFSWRVQILPMMGYEKLYDSLNKDEPWNSPHNTKVLSQVSVEEYRCPKCKRNENNFSTNYVAVIGLGTAWREDGPVKLSDLPDNGSHTVMAVEVVNSGVHWAEPRDLSVEEALEHLKTGQGLHISTAHPISINVLFADGRVCSLPSKMSISLWRKTLAGEDVDQYSDEYAPDMVDISINRVADGRVILLSFVVWLFSVVLVFRRAIKSRRKGEIAG
jgi:hypothetical protein